MSGGHGALTLSACENFALSIITKMTLSEGLLALDPEVQKQPRYRWKCFPALLYVDRTCRSKGDEKEEEVRCRLSSVSWHAHDQLDQPIDGVHMFISITANLRERRVADSNGCLTTIHRKGYPILSGTEHRRLSLGWTSQDVLPEA
jgi:hypothetical protein